MTMNIVCLHGFLGRPQDFNFLKDSIDSEKSIVDFSELNFIFLDYFNIKELSPNNCGIKDWGRQFWAWYKKQYPNTPFVLMGYSLGGRLGLEVLAAASGLNDSKPNTNKNILSFNLNEFCLLKGFVFISTGFGLIQNFLPTDELQNKFINECHPESVDSRWLADQKWAEIFYAQDFSKALQLWNSQSVFNGTDSAVQRTEAEYSKIVLKNVFLNWSPSKQINHIELLSGVSVPVLWISGELDQKYSFQNKWLQINNSNKNINYKIIPQSGHRILMDQPNDLKELIFREFFNLIP